LPFFSPKISLACTIKHFMALFNNMFPNVIHFHPTLMFVTNARSS
jgi:hypothetical protein